MLAAPEPFPMTVHNAPPGPNFASYNWLCDGASATIAAGAIAAPDCDVVIAMRPSRPANAGSEVSRDQTRVTRPAGVASTRRLLAEEMPSDGVLWTPPWHVLPPAGMVQR